MVKIWIKVGEVDIRNARVTSQQKIYILANFCEFLIQHSRKGKNFPLPKG